MELCNAKYWTREVWLRLSRDTLELKTRANGSQQKQPFRTQKKTHELVDWKIRPYAWERFALQHTQIATRSIIIFHFHPCGILLLCLLFDIVWTGVFFASSICRIFCKCAYWAISTSRSKQVISIELLPFLSLLPFFFYLFNCRCSHRCARFRFVVWAFLAFEPIFISSA